MLLRKSAHQRVLDKIVGPVPVADQRPRVAAQPGDLSFK
jgi:hypothetical protein